MTASASAPRRSRTRRGAALNHSASGARGCVTETVECPERAYQPMTSYRVYRSASAGFAASQVCTANAPRQPNVRAA